MNEEACLTSELEQPHKQLRQAREKVRQARRERSLAVAEVDMLATCLVRVNYGNKPFKERMPRIRLL